MEDILNSFDRNSSGYSNRNVVTKIMDGLWTGIKRIVNKERIETADADRQLNVLNVGQSSQNVNSSFQRIPLRIEGTEHDDLPSDPTRWIQNRFMDSADETDDNLLLRVIRGKTVQEMGKKLRENEREDYGRINNSTNVILMLTANPTEQKLPFEEDVSQIKRQFEDSGWRFVLKDNCSRYDLLLYLIQQRPDAVHIDAHGDLQGNVLLHRTGEGCQGGANDGVDKFAPDEFGAMWTYGTMQNDKAPKLLYLDFCHSHYIADCVKREDNSLYIISSNDEIQAGMAREIFMQFYERYLSCFSVSVEREALMQCFNGIIKNVQDKYLVTGKITLQ